ncbi:hypothetical protein [Allonocardiopsis opalescens]|uniref:hypothetical protein n=1 Tax=Allonocardiopsis opalescens TaxID=1144618 RepID=UPI0011B1D4F7|nr:hypothetical protein [Allonocardiopsis opalescens]
MTTADLDRVAARIVADVVRAATASPGSGGYDWWKVLFALYPNAKPTHAKRDRDPDRLHEQVSALFVADGDAADLLPCAFCGAPSGAVWAKSTLPMFDSPRALNTLPPDLGGWPVCRACRLAMWALPYGAWVTAGSATVLTCDDGEVERAFVARNVLRSARARQAGFQDLPAGAGPEAVAVRMLREHAQDHLAATTLWMFKNDNQEPWLRVMSTRTGVARFLQRMSADRACADGWNDLRRVLVRRDASGAVTTSGTTAAARTLFDFELVPGDRLLRELRNRSTDPDKVPTRTLWRWRALFSLYMEVMYEVTTKPLEPAAHLLARWIAAESSRGRFNEYRQAAGSAYPLHKLLMTAHARLLLDGAETPEMSPGVAAVLPELIADGPKGWRLRAQLYFEVATQLNRLGVAIGKESADDDPADDAPTRFDDPLSDDSDEDA